MIYLDTSSLVELVPTVLARAVEGFPMPVRTLDALHLATIHFLLSREQGLALASYDRRRLQCAEELGIPLADL
jgi:predicted nucleic acid-binding protein